jgi:hypothetical protein
MRKKNGSRKGRERIYSVGSRYEASTGDDIEHFVRAVLSYNMCELRIGLSYA